MTYDQRNTAAIIDGLLRFVATGSVTMDLAEWDAQVDRLIDQTTEDCEREFWYACKKLIAAQSAT